MEKPLKLVTTGPGQQEVIEAPPARQHLQITPKLFDLALARIHKKHEQKTEKDSQGTQQEEEARTTVKKIAAYLKTQYEKSIDGHYQSRNEQLIDELAKAAIFPETMQEYLLQLLVEKYDELAEQHLALFKQRDSELIDDKGLAQALIKDSFIPYLEENFLFRDRKSLQDFIQKNLVEILKAFFYANEADLSKKGMQVTDIQSWTNQVLEDVTRSRPPWRFSDIWRAIHSIVILSNQATISQWSKFQKEQLPLALYATLRFSPFYENKGSFSGHENRNHSKAIPDSTFRDAAKRSELELLVSLLPSSQGKNEFDLFRESYRVLENREYAITYVLGIIKRERGAFPISQANDIASQMHERALLAPALPDLTALPALSRHMTVLMKRLATLGQVNDVLSQTFCGDRHAMNTFAQNYKNAPRIFAHGSRWRINKAIDAEDRLEPKLKRMIEVLYASFELSLAMFDMGKNLMEQGANPKQRLIGEIFIEIMRMFMEKLHEYAVLADFNLRSSAFDIPGLGDAFGELQTISQHLGTPEELLNMLGREIEILSELSEDER